MSNKIEGIPEGWELVAFRKARCLNWFIGSDGEPKQWLNNYESSSVFAIIRKIEKPKQYRPFANATEFRPHREKWFNPKELPDHYIKTIAYNNRNHWNGEESDTWEQMFDKYVFEDGTPFGVEIVE